MNTELRWQRCILWIEDALVRLYRLMQFCSTILDFHLSQHWLFVFGLQLRILSYRLSHHSVASDKKNDRWRQNHSKTTPISDRFCCGHSTATMHCQVLRLSNSNLSSCLWADCDHHGARSIFCGLFLGVRIIQRWQADELTCRNRSSLLWVSRHINSLSPTIWVKKSVVDTCWHGGTANSLRMFPPEWPTNLCCYNHCGFNRNRMK